MEILPSLTPGDLFMLGRSAASKLFMFGRLAVPKTLKILRKTLTKITWRDPLDPHPNRPAIFCPKIIYGTSSALIWEKLNRGVSKPGGGSHFLRERSGLCRGPFRDCSSWALLIGRERGKGGQIGKIPKNRESPKKDRKGQKRKDKSRSGNPPI